VKNDDGVGTPQPGWIRLLECPIDEPLDVRSEPSAGPDSMAMQADPFRVAAMWMGMM